MSEAVYLKTRNDYQARVEELEAEVKDHEQWAQRMMDDPKSEPYVKLLAENQRLREALEGILSWDTEYWEMKKIARAALQEPTDD